MQTSLARVHRLRPRTLPRSIIVPVHTVFVPNKQSQRSHSFLAATTVLESLPSSPCSTGTPPKPKSYTRIASLGAPNGRVVGPSQQVVLELPAHPGLELQILARAKEFGIKSIEALRNESAFEYNLRDGIRLVDQAQYKDNLELWSVLLDFQHTCSGYAGVKKVWKVMKDRAGRLDSFFTGPISDRLWAILISAGLQDHDFLKRLCRHEAQFGAQRSTLFIDVIGKLLASAQFEAAHSFSHELQKHHTVTADELHRLLKQACGSKNNHALRHFRHVCKTVPNIRMYPLVMPYLCNEGNFSEAWAMHNFFLARGDLPPNFDVIKPLIQHFDWDDLQFEELLRGLKKANVSFEGQARRLYADLRGLRYGFSTGNLNVVSSRTLGQQGTKLSDQFVARAFATSAFSFNFIFNGLRILGLGVIGPLALRQIALGAGDPLELCRRLALLQDAGVDHGSSMYARVVTRLAMQNKTRLLANVIDSDQHPDVFEDLNLQERLLLQYYRNSDWGQVDRTLFILGIGTEHVTHNIGLSDQEVFFNLLLQCALRVGDRKGVARLMTELKSCKRRLTKPTLRCMYDSILSRRERTLRPTIDLDFDDIGYLVYLWQTATDAGTQIPAGFWREPIRRLGMLRRWVDLERLLLWLAAIYSRYSVGHGTSASTSSITHHATHFSSDATSAKDPSALNIIFSAPLQRAIVAWAFLSPHPQRVLPHVPSKLRFGMSARKPDIPWTRGISVLRQLKTSYGVPIHVLLIRRVCLQRLRILFGQDYLSGRRVNWGIRRKNQVPVQWYLERLNQAWAGAGTLFPVGGAETQADLAMPNIRKQRSFPRRHSELLPQKRELAKSGRSTKTAPHDTSLLQDANASREASVSYHPDTLYHHGTPLQVKDIEEAAQDQLQHKKENDTSADKDAEPVEDVIMYRDLFNASWTDYQKPGRK